MALKIQLKGYSDSGQNLDALQFKNQKYQLHIGTEDFDSIKERAKNRYFIPNRFFALIDEANDFTNYETSGFTTNFPLMKKEEIIKFHYLIAESNIQNKDDMRTWSAVNQTIEQVEKIITYEKNTDL